MSTAEVTAVLAGVVIAQNPANAPALLVPADVERKAGRGSKRAARQAFVSTYLVAARVSFCGSLSGATGTGFIGW